MFTPKSEFWRYFRGGLPFKKMCFGIFFTNFNLTEVEGKAGLNGWRETATVGEEQPPAEKRRRRERSRADYSRTRELSDLRWGKGPHPRLVGPEMRLRGGKGANMHCTLTFGGQSTIFFIAPYLEWHLATSNNAIKYPKPWPFCGLDHIQHRGQI